jgi:hypothetical protein
MYYAIYLRIMERRQDQAPLILIAACKIRPMLEVEVAPITLYGQLAHLPALMRWILSTGRLQDWYGWTRPRLFAW